MTERNMLNYRMYSTMYCIERYVSVESDKTTKVRYERSNL